jgi:lipopolysaccharide export system permease protein
MKIGRFNFSFRSIPGFSLLDRYLFLELLLPLLFGMGLFTSLGIAIGTLFDLVRRITEFGLPLSTALQILLLKMPEFIVLAFPMSMLLATLMAYSRLSSDSELIALRSIGINIYRLILPAVILSILVTGLTFAFHNYIAPASTYQATITLAKALKREKLPYDNDNIIYPEYTKITQPDGNIRTVLLRLFYAEEFDGRQMKRITILDRSQPDVNQIITSQSAVWNLESNKWDFYNGTIYLIAPDGDYRNIVRFDHQELSLPRAPLDIANRGRDAAEMNIQQAREYLKIVQLSGDQVKARKLEVRIQEKIALPFVCIIFGLIGSSMGVRPQTTNRATSFGICVVLIFSYYLLSFISSSFGVWGVLSPIMAAWLPNTLGLIAGILLLVRSA